MSARIDAACFVFGGSVGWVFLYIFKIKEEYRTRNKECPILKFKGMTNNEQGMSNVEVLACVN